MTREPDTLPGSVDDLTRGVDSVLGREVAMVSLPPARGEALATRTEQVRRLAGLHHPNLLEVYDVDGLAEDTASTLVLQSVEGHSLAGVADTAPWPAVSVAHVGSQIADGLAQAHTHGVVHGGIGPASIVVDESLHAWLTGFTAALGPARVETPTDTRHAAPSPDDDVAALGTTLRALLDTSTPVPTVIDTVLVDMTGRRLDARGSASALAEAAETCAHGGVAGAVVPMAVYSARISPGHSNREGLTGAAWAPATRGSWDSRSPSVPLSACSPDPVPAAAAASAAAAIVAAREQAPAAAHTPVPNRTPTRTPVPEPAGSEPVSSTDPRPAASVSAVVDSTRGRTSRVTGRGLRSAVLGGATVALAAASGAVLWAANSFVPPVSSPAGTVLDGPATVVDPTGSGFAPAAPPATDVGPDPVSDVTTLVPNSEDVARPTVDIAPLVPLDEGTRPAGPPPETTPPETTPPETTPPGTTPPGTTPPGTTPPETTPPETTPPETTPPETTPPETTPPETTPPESTPPESTPPETTPPETPAEQGAGEAGGRLGGAGPVTSAPVAAAG